MRRRTARLILLLPTRLAAADGSKKDPAAPAQPTLSTPAITLPTELTGRPGRARTGYLMEPCYVQHERHDWLRASLNGLDLTGSLVLEIKVPNAVVHRLVLPGQVLDYCSPQVQHQLKLPRCIT